jgi:hypothetical protein
MAHAVLCRRDRPAIVVDVGPPHVEHLAHALTGQQAQAEQGGQSGINGIEGVPKRAKLAGCSGPALRTTVEILKQALATEKDRNAELRAERDRLAARRSWWPFRRTG